MESEPAYQYVRGNPVNLTDKSGLFSSEKIQDSLEGNRRIGDYFQNRPGLYWLLRNASEKDRVTPLVVDFVFSNDKYPLRSSNPDTQALIRCENQMLRFETSMGSLTLRQYLAYLDRVARQQDKSEWWRVETMELHYYKLSHSKTEVSYYNDLLDDNYNTSVLPDYVGDSTSLPVKWILSAGWANLFDRHGYYYKVIFGGVGFGVNPPNAFEGYPSLSSGTYVEGYLSTRSEDLIKSSLTGAGYSQQAGLLYGEAVSIPLSWFSDLSSSVPYREHSVGFQIGTSINIGWGEQRGPRNEAMRWDWLENLKHPSTVPSTSDDDRFYLDPWWRSAFLNSGSGNNCSCER